MLRALVVTGLTLCLFANVGLCGDEAKKKKKKNKGGLSGEIVKLDADRGTLTVKVSLKKKQFEEKEFKVTETTALTSNNALALLKKDAFKVGTIVSVQPDEDGTTAKAIAIGAPPKKKKKQDQ